MHAPAHHIFRPPFGFRLPATDYFCLFELRRLRSMRSHQLLVTWFSTQRREEGLTLCQVVKKPTGKRQQSAHQVSLTPALPSFARHCFLPACSNRLCISSEGLRTVNTLAECGGPDDYYYYSPWRAPGAAPVIDSCGTAGGRFPGKNTKGERAA